MTVYEELRQQAAELTELKHTLEWYKKSHQEVCQDYDKLKREASLRVQESNNAAQHNMALANDRLDVIDSLNVQVAALKSVSLKETPPVDWEHQGSNPPSTQAKLESIRADLKAKGISGEAYIARLIEVLIEKEQGNDHIEPKGLKHHVIGKNENAQYGSWFVRLKC